MTGLLLDTHAYVWAVTDSAKLSASAAELVSDPATAVSVSAASTWEMAIKHRAGRWPEAELLLRDHIRILTQLRAASLPIEADDTIHAGGLAWEHRDPFDRMIATQAMRRGLMLVSRDSTFRSLPGLQVVW